MSQISTEAELAAFLRVEPETVRSLAREGRIPVIRLGRKTRRYDLDAVMAAVSVPQVANSQGAAPAMAEPSVA